MNSTNYKDYKDLYSIREWAPLTNVFEKIPEQISKGFFLVDLNMTCIDAIENFLALGSDAGIVFWYNRITGDVQKLKSEDTACITCVKIVNSVDYMIAAGSLKGQVNVFQIQKEIPPDLDLIAPCTRPKSIVHYVIRNLHHSKVTSCEWSKNSMKLFSGDHDGVVVLTEFDYQNNLSKSAQILSESYEIVQLCFHQNSLLISTSYRSIICHRNSGSFDWNVIQIGQKDRKVLANCGGVVLKCTDSGKSIKLICGRPGLRFWIANLQGDVEKTLLLRDAVVQNPQWKIPILNPKFITPHFQSFIDPTIMAASQNFRNIYVYNGHKDIIVTHDQTTLYLLNWINLTVEAVASGFRKIIDFCVFEEEIFILEGHRSIVRLAPKPEKPNKNAKIIFNPFLPHPVPSLGFVVNNSYETDTISAEECLKLLPIENINLNVPIELGVESSRAEQKQRLEIFNQISEHEFDQPILHHNVNEKKNKKKKHYNGKSMGIVEIGQTAVVNNSEELFTDITTKLIV